MTLVKQSDFKPENLNLDLNNTPDIAQTIVVTCLGLELVVILQAFIPKNQKMIDWKHRIENGSNYMVTNDSLTLR
jgi:3-phosphoshikimate 1-carboxyvinyltransferase